MNLPILELRNYKPPKPDQSDQSIQTEAIVIDDTTTIGSESDDEESDVHKLHHSNRELSMVSMETIHLVPTRPTSADRY